MTSNNKKQSSDKEDKFENKPDYQKNMSKRSKNRSKQTIVIKEEPMDIPDNDHIELFLKKNIST